MCSFYFKIRGLLFHIFKKGKEKIWLIEHFCSSTLLVCLIRFVLELVEQFCWKQNPCLFVRNNTSNFFFLFFQTKSQIFQQQNNIYSPTTLEGGKQTNSNYHERGWPTPRDEKTHLQHVDITLNVE